MLLSPQAVELLAPVGTWDVLEAAVAAGADAVYLGGKRFNMRLHRTDTNFNDETLARAIKYAHDHNVRLYVTVNNLISEREIPGMQEYLKLLNQLQPDSLIVQDLAILQLAREMQLTVPLHASVMMNTHNEYSIKTLMDYGVTRIVANRELSLSQLTLLKERTGIELEYFIHGDMCVAHSGQCYHSGIIFGQSSNRGRCLKPCRWPYQLVDTATRQTVTAANDPGPYKLAMKDMCMYTALPQLIQAGVCSFKIEGRMRTADFVSRIVKTYRRAIDRYIADPTGYTFAAADWQELSDYRSRDFSTCYAFGNPGASSIGYTGEREPRFFSQAVKEAGVTAAAFLPTVLSMDSADSTKRPQPQLAVRVADLSSLTSALQNGATIVYVGGEAFKPNNPWTLKDLEAAVSEARNYRAEVIVTTPRITMERESSEAEQLFKRLEAIKPHGVMVSNSGMLRLARQTANLPIQADFSFNLFNHLTAAWLKDNAASKATISLEATYEQIAELAQNSPLPLEMIVHGPLEAMVLDHCLPSAILAGTATDPCHDLCSAKHYSLLDSAGERHDIKIDQYCRNHILFANDLCLLPHLSALMSAGINHYRIEGQHYSPELVGLVTSLYRTELDKLTADKTYTFDKTGINKLTAASPRPLGIGAFRYRLSR